MGMRRLALVLSTILLILLGVGCSKMQAMPIPTTPSPDDLSTQVQLTQVSAPIPTSSILTNTTPADFPPIGSTATPQETPSLEPGSPTSMAQQQTATSSPTPFATNTPNQVSSSTPRPTRTPTPTPTPTIPPAGVQINSPGPMSRVASPLNLTANLHSVPSGSYFVELWIEPLQPDGDPRMLYREVQRLISNPVDWIYLDEHIEFELSRVSEYGQLRISVFDSFNRAVSINSVDLILLQLGMSSLTPAAPKTEPIVIQEPFPNKLIQGGVLVVSGIAMPAEEYLHVQMVTADGTIVGYKDQAITPAPDGGYVPYTIEVPYAVETPTWVRLQVSETNPRIAGIDHLSSVQVLLSP
jgi:hypothetical protein